MIVDWRETEYQTNMRSRLFVNVAVVESKGWLFHVAVDPLFACIKLSTSWCCSVAYFVQRIGHESVILEEALCSKFLTSDGVERLRRKRSLWWILYLSFMSVVETQIIHSIYLYCSAACQGLQITLCRSKLINDTHLK